MCRILRGYDHKRFATTGREALRLAREEVPDLILLDADMPGMSGFDVLTELKADPILAPVPVIFATGMSEPDFEVAAIDQGAVDFVAKPLRESQLLARVNSQLRAKAERETALPFAPSRDPDAPPRVLIVDDDVSAIQTLRHALADIGDCHFARSGDEALRQARLLIPDLILLDVRMDGTDGMDVCRALKSDDVLRHVPIVLVTRFADPETETLALNLGAEDFFAKPFHCEILRARVRGLLERKRRAAAAIRQAEEQARHLADARVAEIVAAASDGIVTTDANGRIALINAAAGRLFGVEPRYQVGRTLQELGISGLEVSSLSLGTVARHELTLRDGLRLPVELSAFAVGERSVRLITLVLRDVSDRERLERETHARLEADAASRAKTAMMSYLAHEIGNPLNGVLGLVQLMTLDSQHPLPAPQAKRLELLQTCARQLHTLLRDVLEVSRFEAGKLSVSLRPTDVGQAVHSALAAVQAQAQISGITLRSPAVTSSDKALADGDRLEQCLVNLLSNAVKYNRRGGRVAVRVQADSRTVSLVVQDNGLGMDAEQCLHLFEPFNRLGREGGTAHGVGLGLMITRHLIEAMGGTIEVHSDLGSGSRFVVVLPRADTASTAP